jgi:hypothetical protein
VLWRVQVRDAAGTQLHVLRVDDAGRLTVALDLGRGNRYQQYSTQAKAAPGRAVTAHVRIEGLR